MDVLSFGLGIAAAFVLFVIISGVVVIVKLTRISKKSNKNIDKMLSKIEGIDQRIDWVMDELNSAISEVENRLVDDVVNLSEDTQKLIGDTEDLIEKKNKETLSYVDKRFDKKKEKE